MAKIGRDKNTKNKSKHTKLMNRKKKKLREKEQSHKDRLNALKTVIKKTNSNL